MGNWSLNVEEKKTTQYDVVSLLHCAYCQIATVRVVASSNIAYIWVGH